MFKKGEGRTTFSFFITGHAYTPQPFLQKTERAVKMVEIGELTNTSDLSPSYSFKYLFAGVYELDALTLVFKAKGFPATFLAVIFGFGHKVCIDLRFSFSKFNDL